MADAGAPPGRDAARRARADAARRDSCRSAPGRRAAAVVARAGAGARRLARRRQRRVRPARGTGVPHDARARGAGRRRGRPVGGRPAASRSRQRAPPRYDLTPTTPDVTLFPLARWLAAAQHAARRASTVDARLPRAARRARVARGARRPPRPHARGDRRARSRSSSCRARRRASTLLLRILPARGASRVAVEDPSHPTQHERIRALGLELVRATRRRRRARRSTGSTRTPCS